MDDGALLQSLHALVAHERENVADILAHLIVIDDRDLTLKAAYSLFYYCTKVLGYSEQAAYIRIHAARACARFPSILNMIRRQRLHLTAVTRLAPHLNSRNHRRLLYLAKDRTKVELDKLVASLAPKEDAPDSIKTLRVDRRHQSLASGRREPAPETPVDSNNAAASSLMPLFQNASSPAANSETTANSDSAPAADQGRVRFSFTGSEALRLQIQQARGLLLHKYPYCKLEDIISEAVEAFLDRKDPIRQIARKEKNRAQRAAAKKRKHAAKIS